MDLLRGGGVDSGGAGEVGAGAVFDFQAGGGAGADPVEIAEAPEVGEADDEDAEEEEHVDQGGFSEFEGSGAEGFGDVGGVAPGDGPWVEEGDFDIENQVDQGYDVKAEVELHPTGAHGWLAAFVAGGFLGIGDARADQRSGHEVGQDEGGTECDENGDGEKEFHVR